MLFLVVKFAAVPIKFPDNWRHGQKAFVQVEQIDTPLMRLWVVEPECLGFDVQMLLWIVDFEFLKIGVAVEQLLMIRDAVVLDPIVGPNKAVGKPAHVSFPIADEEIKIVRSIACGRRRFTSERTG